MNTSTNWWKASWRCSVAIGRCKRNVGLSSLGLLLFNDCTCCNYCKCYCQQHIRRQLCVLLSAEDIYRSLAKILIDEENCRFASLMVETLSTLLMTSSELFSLRRKLKDLNSKVFFFPISTFILRPFQLKAVILILKWHRKVASCSPCCTGAGATIRSQLSPCACWAKTICKLRP